MGLVYCTCSVLPQLISGPDFCNAMDHRKTCCWSSCLLINRLIGHWLGLIYCSSGVTSASQHTDHLTKMSNM